MDPVRRTVTTPSYRTASPPPRCADCEKILGTISSCLFVYGKSGELLCPQCSQMREIAEAEAAERTRRRRERLATTLRLGSLAACAVLTAALRTETEAILAILGVFIVGSTVAEVISPSAFRTWIGS